MNNLSLFNELEQLLRNESAYCSEDGILLKNAIVEAALALRPSLIKLLLSHDGLKRNFFTEIDGVLVFDKIKFQKFVMNKRFLPDSYTSFKNKIGLTTEDGDFISDSREVVLSWPYKDCVLEGGQTKEDAKRNEVFWNEILAPDEINRLTEPKALSNFQTIYPSKSNIDAFSNTDNMIIKGNNLLALFCLKKVFKGKVNLIYIDPPFNTGGDSFGYNDKFNHSTWLTFMRTRLKVAKELLSPNGSILVHLDWNEVHYCKVLMDEIFGVNNFRNEIIWCYNGPGSPKMKQLNRKHDNILWYSNSPETWIFNGDEIRLESEVHVGGFNGEMTANVSGEYTEKGKVPEDWWTLFHTEDDLQDEIQQLKNASYDDNGDWLKCAVAARIRVDGEKRTGYLTEKPYKLLERLIEMTTKKGDLVLDFFGGSGTTGYSANRLGRRFILIEQLEETITLMRKRFQKVKGFYCELATANQTLVDEIFTAESTDDLKKIWERMQQTGFLSWKVEPKQFEENAKSFEELSLDDQKLFLVECLDKNLLYIPLSEVDNDEFGLDSKDRELTRKFYAM
ncbi:MAG: site-specific DNA-methyltransferase [Bacteroidales bacterium]|nr:site-specific DNA-methyltransferase [Bacteroidales bacterium]